ncbi:protein kinase 4 isoform X2 [Daktulosphaira vitifoliae]|uniref:protein kinase 4 isoform X2 n=2 Tax=Daktulosphaira vitifoliae TaxID=58002 RepID=UPI0021AA2018|nr:protein kinase 4 isoform X2 [Daktulosphaira vitifoliae]
MKFLGPIKLNKPYNTSTSVSQNLPLFPINTIMDSRTNGSRTALSKYSVLLNKNIMKENDIKEHDDKLMNKISLFRKENSKKINITLTESINQSDSSTSELDTEDLNDESSDEIIKRSTKIKDYHSSENYNNNQKKDIQAESSHMDFLKYDSENIENNSVNLGENVQSSENTEKLAVTESIVANIAKKFPLTKPFNKTPDTDSSKTFDSACDINTFEIKEISSNKISETEDKFVEKKKNSDKLHIEAMVVNQCSIIKNELEDVIQNKESLIRNELIKKIDDLVYLTNKNSETMEKRINKLFEEYHTKKNVELIDTVQNLQNKLEKNMAYAKDKHDMQCSLDNQKIYNDISDKINKELENKFKELKNQIVSDTNEASKLCSLEEIDKKSITVINDWDQSLETLISVKTSDLKNNLDKKLEDTKCLIEIETNKCVLNYKERLETISEDKLKSAAEELNSVLREELIQIKKRTKEENLKIIDKRDSNNHEKLYPKQLPNEDPNNLNNLDVNNLNYRNIKQKIWKCLNELNDVLQALNSSHISDFASPNDNGINKSSICTNKCSVSSQTDLEYQQNTVNYFTQPISTQFSSWRNSFRDSDTKYTQYWNQAKNYQDILSNYMLNNVYTANPLENLNQEEYKIKVAENNLSNLIDALQNTYYNNNSPITLNNDLNYWRNSFNTNNGELKTNQIAYNQTKNLKEWLYKFDIRNKKFY